MASSKKPTTARKKTAASSARTVKKTTARKPAAKRAPAKARSATTVRRSTAAKPKSFRRSKPEQPFMSFSLTNQTFYWLVLGGIIVVFALWIITLHNQVQDIYDTIDQQRAAEFSLVQYE